MEAINQYREDHGMVPMVVCSRSTDYLSQTARLILSSAVMVQPLSGEQIEDYLSQCAELAAMRIALKQVPALQELCSTPLMLSILTLCYAGMTVEEVYKISSSEDHRSVVLDRYVERLLRRRPSEKYSDQKVKQWLGWLAWHMSRHDQTEFYLERLQPSWLSAHQVHRYQQTVIRLIIGVECIVFAILIAWIRGGERLGNAGVGAGIIGLLGGEPGNGILEWMAPGFGGGLQGGGSLAFTVAVVFWMVTLVAASPIAPITLQAILRGMLAGLRTGIKIGLPIAVLSIAIFGATGGIEHGLNYGSGMGIYCAMLFGMLRGLMGILCSEESVNTSNRPLRLSRFLVG
jgi:hypothetical protein